MVEPAPFSQEDREFIDGLFNDSLERLQALAGQFISGGPDAQETFNDVMDKASAAGAKALHERFPENNEAAKQYYQGLIEPLLSASVYWNRIYHKPRGYSGDFLTMEMMYCAKPLPEPGEHPFSALLDAWFLNAPSSRANRNRQQHIVATLSRHIDQGARKIASFASGPCREVRTLLDNWVGESRQLEFYFIDLDEVAHDYARELLAGAAANEAKFHFMKANLIEMATGKQALPVTGCDFVYCVGFVEYLEDAQLPQLFERAYEMLSPGGSLVIGHFVARDDQPDRLRMEWSLGWNFNYRTADQIRDAFSQTSFGANVTLQTEPLGLIMFAEARKEA